MKVIDIELKGSNRRADDSVSFKCDSLREISSKEIGEIDSYRGTIGLLVLTETVIGNEVNIDIDEILKNRPESDLYDNHKTPSQRLRGVLWHLCKKDIGRKPTEEEFADFYTRKIESIITHLKAKLDN